METPPESLIKTLLEESSFDSMKVPALRWGLTHEDQARSDYIKEASVHHVNFTYSDSGLHVNPRFPHLGASPDGMINCKCCGKGLIEIKCPYKYRNEHPCFVTDPKFYLNRENGETQLREDHEYFFQVQGQLAICDLTYCDFICWTTEGLHCERILYDPLHFQRVKPVLDNFLSLFCYLDYLLVQDRKRLGLHQQLPVLIAGVEGRMKEE